MAITPPEHTLARFACHINHRARLGGRRQGDPGYTSGEAATERRRPAQGLTTIAPLATPVLSVIASHAEDGIGSCGCRPHLQEIGIYEPIIELTGCACISVLRAYPQSVST